MLTPKVSPWFQSVWVLFLGATLFYGGCRPAQTAPPEAQGEDAAPVVVPASDLALGEKIYGEYCVMCHLAGEGSPTAPPLISSPGLKGDALPSIQITLFGSSGQKEIGSDLTGIMPPQDYLEDAEVAAVLTYMRQAFGEAAAPLVTADEVAAARSKGAPE